MKKLFLRGPEPVIVGKVVAYITQGDRLLVFRHVDFPEEGIQVPAGTIEPGETTEEAVLREAREETGLDELILGGFLGSNDLDARPYGKNEIHRRRFFHLEFTGQAPEIWRHNEETPSGESPGPILFELYWVRLPDEIPDLTGAQGAFLNRLIQKSKE
jgi:8-oxo-dGTP pyrophosphatase MutT (NUDIX family)